MFSWFSSPFSQSEARFRLLLTVSLIVGCGLQTPDVRAHRRFPVRAVLLRVESREISRLLGRVMHTSTYGCGYYRELAAYCEFFCGRLGGAGYRTQSTQIYAGTVGTGCRCGTVSCQHHLLITGMRRFLVDFVQCTGDSFKHRCIRRFCHTSL